MATKEWEGRKAWRKALGVTEILGGTTAIGVSIAFGGIPAILIGIGAGITMLEGSRRIVTGKTLRQQFGISRRRAK